MLALFPQRTSCFQHPVVLSCRYFSRTVQSATLRLMKVLGLLLVGTAVAVVIILWFYYRPTIEYLYIGGLKLK